MLTDEELEQLQTILMHDKTLYNKILTLPGKHFRLLEEQSKLRANYIKLQEKYDKLRANYNGLVKGTQIRIGKISEYVEREYVKEEYEERKGD